MLSRYPFRLAKFSLLNSALGPSLAKKNEAFHHFLSQQPSAEVGAQASDTELAFSPIHGHRNTSFGSRHVLTNSLWLFAMIALLLTFLPSLTFAKDPAAEKGKATQVERKPNQMPVKFNLQYSKISRVVDRAQQNVCYVATTSQGGVKMSCLRTPSAASLESRAVGNMESTKFFKVEDPEANVYCYVAHLDNSQSVEINCTEAP